MIVYQCEDSLEGIFTAIYNTYEDRCNHADTRISVQEEYLLFAEYVPVVTEVEKAIKVINTIKAQFGEENYWQICQALSSEDSEKAQVVYQTIVEGLATKTKYGCLLDNLANADIHKVFTLARATNNEYLHLRGFIRFQELMNGILYTRITPKNNVLTALMPHFADRFPQENFMIHDEKRGMFGIHPKGAEWYVVKREDLKADKFLLELSDDEERYQRLFQYFCQKIAIKERRNLGLQRNMLPLRFRENMVEF